MPGAYTNPLRDLRKRHSAEWAVEPAEVVIAAGKLVAHELRQEWKWLGYELIRFHREAFNGLSQDDLIDLSKDVASWYAVDGLGTILVGPLWLKGRLFDAVVTSWSLDENRWLRRLSLVATVGLNLKGGKGPGDAGRTLPICRQLASDRDDMVEKALSWALRTLAKRDRPAVVDFIAECDGLLASRVKREVRNLLKFGTKAKQ